ncbi:MAG: hypothetical protein KKA73_17070 [Chloroflexi bacterium]|nr:hypothetical protein [Chloroflexota bacterium]MBU1749400.1 hypothetical protein [Chloroflexota bacterium]
MRTRDFVTNAGLSSMTNVAIEDNLPALQRPLTANSDLGTCTIVNNGYGGRVTCAISSLGGNQAAHITITAQATTSVPPTLPQPMRNNAQASIDQATTVTTYADTILQDCRACVNGAGPVYGTAQAAVDAASPGDAVWIAGTCVGADAGQQVHVTQDLTLRGGYRADFGTWDPATYPTTLDAAGQGRVVTVQGPAQVMLESLRITGGDATGLGGLDWSDAGGGLYAITATVTLSDTQVTGNIASTQGQGFGGGVGVATTTLDHNTGATGMFGMGHGGGLAAEFSIVHLQNSRLENNVAGPFFGEGGGAYVFESDLDADATIWFSNTASASGWGLGGGLYVTGDAPFALTNCVLTENQSDDGSGAGGSGLAVDGAPGVLLHPTIARNRGSEAVSLSYTSTVAITNAVVVSHSVGIRATDGGAATVNGVLWHDNVTNTVGNVTVNNALAGDPAFEPDGYHVTPGSPARDSGVPDDIDGQARPFGPAYDLGADEYAYYVVTGVHIDGPTDTVVGVPQTFTATISPITATQPITYIWEATGLAGVVHPNGGIVDTAVFTWPVAGPQWVTVTAANKYSPGASTPHGITATNQPPVANAGANLTVTVGSPVTLDGSGSHDPDEHLPLAYGWTQTGGPAVGGPWSVVKPAFTAPGTPANLTFSLMVTDSVGLASVVPDTVVVIVISNQYHLYLPLVLRNF